ncbi:unnamed protein product [Leuciscus chuanchicus]
MLGLMASASSVLQLGLLRMRPLQFWLKARVPRRAWASGLLRLKVNQKCIAALKPWKANDWYQSGVSLGTSSSVKVVSTDASTSGWGALLEGRLFFGQWSEREKLLHINCLEILPVDNALTRFCPQIRGHHVLVRSDNMSVVSYINRQGGLRSRNLHRLTERLLVWAQRNLLSLRAAHVPGLLNVGPDRLSRNNVPTGEWSLHPQTVQLLWKKFGRAEVDLFASQENAHCLEFFSKSRDALAHEWPRRPLYAFPPVSLLPQVIERIREEGCSVLLAAPFWKNQPWFPVLMELASTAPWPVPVRRDLLSQAKISIWHPRPELWFLHVWAINGVTSLLRLPHRQETEEGKGNCGHPAVRVLSAFKVCNIVESTYFLHASSFMEPCVFAVWKRTQADLIQETKSRPGGAELGGDMRADSPGHCAKYGSYSMMDLNTGKMIDVQLVQSNECGGSAKMEKEGLIRSLYFLENSAVKVASIVTDRHSQIQKFLRIERNDIEHFYDVWHVAKGVSKKVEALAKMKDCNELKRWQQSLVNHLYWCAISSSSGEEAVAKWTSFSNHVQNIHSHDNVLFPECLHPALDGSRPKKWLKSGM